MARLSAGLVALKGPARIGASTAAVNAPQPPTSSGSTLEMKQASAILATGKSAKSTVALQNSEGSADDIGSLPSFGIASSNKKQATSLQDIRNASTSPPAKTANKSASSIHAGPRGLTASTSEDVTTLGVFRPFMHRCEGVDIHVVKISPENDYIAVGLGNSHVHVNAPILSLLWRNRGIEDHM